MKLQYTNDTAKGPGYGFLHVSELGILAASEDFSFSIERGAAPKFLGVSGWQADQTYIAPNACEQGGEHLTLAVGPAVVDNLDAGTTYRCTLKGSDNATGEGIFSVSGVLYSQSSGGRGVGVNEAAPQPVKAAPAPAPVQAVQPVQEAAPQAESSPSFVAPAPEAPLTAASTATSGSKKWIVLAVVILLLICGGLAAWKFLGSSGPAQLPPITQARQHLSGAADPATSLSMALSFRTQEDGADAAFLLAEDAAQKGDPAAMILTGDFYSPADTAPGGSIQKDALQAFLWYSQAQEAGSADAAARLDALRAWAEQEAAGGAARAEAEAVLEKFAE